MQKAKVILLSLLVAACSVVMLPGTAISAGNGGEQLTQNSLQLGVGYDFFQTDTLMTALPEDPPSVPLVNLMYDLDFEYGAKYVYVKYGIFDWLEVGGRIGLLGMENAWDEKVGSDDATFETDGEFAWAYWGLHIKARIYESQSGFFTTIALNYERGDSDDITAGPPPMPANSATGLQFDLLTATLIAGWKFQTVTPYAGVGFTNLEIDLEINPVVWSPQTIEFENENDWTGILGVNVHITEPIVLTVEGALGSDIGSVSAQLGYTFL